MPARAQNHALPVVPRPDVCLSLGGVATSEALAWLRRVPLAELRLDLLDIPPGRLPELCRAGASVVATCRRGPGVGGREASRRLLAAIDAGCALVDIDLDFEPSQARPLLAAARAAGVRVVVSRHDFARTPHFQALQEVAGLCFDRGADIAKIAVLARAEGDLDAIRALYPSPRPLVAFGMGAAGAPSRVECLAWGSPFTYACLDGHATAPGQMTYAEICSILNNR